MTAWRGNPRGQAAIEAALTLPISLFLVLGTVQLSLLLQGRLLAQYAIHKATRAGSTNRGSCEAMADAALAALLPSFFSFTAGASSARPARRFASAFRDFKSSAYRYRSPQLVNFDGPVFWLRRDHPTRAELSARGGGGEDLEFDDPDRPVVRLETTLVYWYPMRIPFANWVISRIIRAHFGLANAAAANPLMPTDRRPWLASANAQLHALLAAELEARAALRQYVFPLPVSYTMRMMTPALHRNFPGSPWCGPVP